MSRRYSRGAVPPIDASPHPIETHASPGSSEWVRLPVPALYQAEEIFSLAIGGVDFREKRPPFTPLCRLHRVDPTGDVAALCAEVLENGSDGVT